MNFYKNIKNTSMPYTGFNKWGMLHDFDKLDIDKKEKESKYDAYWIFHDIFFLLHLLSCFNNYFKSMNGSRALNLISTENVKNAGL